MSAAGIAVLIIVLGLLATLWVYSDARKNSSQSAFLWGLVVLFGGILGILLYFLLGRDSVSSSKDYPFYDY